MAISIDQAPLFDILPVGQKVIFAVSDSNAATSYNFKYVAEVYVSSPGQTSLSLSAPSYFRATFKTTPNNAGVGIFDLGPFLESYVSSQNEGDPQSKYKTVVYDSTTPHPIHLIDQFCKGINPYALCGVRFSAEGSVTATDPVVDLNVDTNTGSYWIFNGVLQRNNYLTLGEVNASGNLVAGNNYGYDLGANNFYPGTAANGKFLTNAPLTQYANVDDYGTFAFFNRLPDTTNDKVTNILFVYYKNDGTSVSQSMTQSWTNGGSTNFNRTSRQ